MKTFHESREYLIEFEKKQKDITKNYIEKMNGADNTISSLAYKMATILYEYRRQDTEFKARQTGRDYSSMSEEDKRKKVVERLLGFVQANFSNEEIEEIQDNLPVSSQIANINLEDVVVQLTKLASPVLEIIEQYKHDLVSAYRECAIAYGEDVPVLRHTSLANIENGVINASVNLENQPRNEIVTGVFASSGYSDINMYLGRTFSGGMIARNNWVIYHRSPFLPIEEQKDSQMIELIGKAYIYSVEQGEFEPQVDFRRRDGKYTLGFEHEWVAKKDKLPIMHKEEIMQVPREIVSEFEILIKARNFNYNAYRRLSSEELARVIEEHIENGTFIPFSRQYNEKFPETNNLQIEDEKIKENLKRLTSTVTKSELTLKSSEMVKDVSNKEFANVPELDACNKE